MRYYELYYIYNRELCGSTYVETDRAYSHPEEDEFLKELVQDGKISKGFSQHIFEVTEISEKDYRSFNYQTSDEAVKAPREPLICENMRLTEENRQLRAQINILTRGRFERRRNDLDLE
ncbi:MAG: hypothetical protein KH230_09765 [Enterocloster asparagiformis]|nr:hypothetical protein [Enterocloster asparagiformis]